MSRIPASGRRRRVAAHRADTRPHARIASLGGILTTTAIVGGGAFLGLVGIGGTYAFWDEAAQVAAPEVDSGSMELSVGLSGSETASYTIPSAAWSTLLPGDSVRQQVSVKVNNSPARLSSALTIKTNAAVPAGFELRVAKGACSGGVLTGTPLSTTDVSFGTWTSSETSLVCVQVSLRSDAANATQGTSTGTIGMTLTAEQQ